MRRYPFSRFRLRLGKLRVGSQVSRSGITIWGCVGSGLGIKTGRHLPAGLDMCQAVQQAFSCRVLFEC